ncbi:MAG: hypothetical protein O6837_02985 [Deltaproteobacteria bacterium]|nr:hypothetical protein [Deltaproteobacteria bacterium]MCZ6563629.1 hypothetical protein [Deltaproteobacteria bacterium]MCZ6621885.1 hypothetical protein [Deltaproteobacteria bacterium]
MQRALEIWKKEELPELHFRISWYGVNLGYWPEEREEEDRLAVEGRDYETGAPKLG